MLRGSRTFHNVQLSFQLTVTVAGEPSTSDSIRVSIVSAFYTGNIDRPGLLHRSQLGWLPPSL